MSGRGSGAVGNCLEKTSLRWPALIIALGLILSALVPSAAHADYTSANLPNWAIGPFTRYSGNPILSPQGSGFEAADVFNPGVVNRNGTWQMLYRAQNTDGGPSQIGYASSTDGYHFTRYAGNPVIPDNYSNESAGVEDPRLYTLNGTYYSFFTAYNGNTTDINEATSPDGIHWTQLGPVEFQTKDAAVVTDPNDVPVQIDGKYVMYYGQSSGTGTFIAYSTDFIHWTTGTSVSLGYPSVFYPFEICVAVTDYQTISGGPTNNNIDLFAAGTLNGEGAWFYAISEVEFSGTNPSQVLHQLSDAVLSPAEPYELNGQTPKTVWMNSISFYNGQWWMYYGGGDRVTGLATAPLRPAASPPPAGLPFATSFETGQPLPDWLDSVDSEYPGGGISGVTGICCGLPGPESSMRTENAESGATSLLYSGAATGAASDYAYSKVFDLSDAPITVDSKMSLFYGIYPEGSDSEVSGTNSTCVSVDLVFSDGTTLSSLDATDQNGNRLAPAAQCGHLKTGQWNAVSALIGSVAAGKQIVRIDVGFSDPGGSGGYRGYIDNIALSDATTPPTFAPSVAVTSISPASAAPGDIVTVRGSGFGSTMPSKGFYFSDNGVNWGQPNNGATFVVDSWSDKRITFTVPVPSGPGDQWRVTPGTTSYLCIASNCHVEDGEVQAPYSSFTDTSLPIVDSDTISDYFGSHVGIAPDSQLDCGSQFERFDSTSAGVGNFYDADASQNSLLHPSAGSPLTPGGTYTGSGLTFVWPNTPTCSFDNISSTSTPQTILMPPNSGETKSTTTSLGFLGAGAGGPTSGSVTINYGDGTSSTQTLDFGDWCQTTPTDQTLVASAKRTDGTTCNVFEKVLPVTAGKVVKSITLPATANLTGGDHLRIFAIAVSSNGKTFPQLAWNHPADIDYGTALSATQLDASAGGVAGTFSYAANPTGTILHASASRTLSATFTPTDAAHFASGQVVTTTITVNKLTPRLSWAKPADITYNPQGIGLGSAQLDAKSNVPGSFDYIPNFGTVLTAGSDEPLSAKFTPTDTADDVSGGVVSTTINVKPYPPQLSWSNPSSIVYGTPLSVIQLDPISDAVGSFSFSPPVGTILQPGSGQKLRATFTPEDTVDYVNGETVSAKVDVNKAPLKIVAANQTLHYTDTLPDLSSPPNWTAKGFIKGDSVTSLTSPPDCAATVSVTNGQNQIDVKPGTYTISCQGAAAADYTIHYVSGTLTVLKAGTDLAYEGPSTFAEGAKATLSATLETVNTTPREVAGAKITLGFKSGKTCTATTTTAGLASCSVTAPDKAGSATVTAIYAGSTYYLSATKDEKVEVTT